MANVLSNKGRAAITAAWSAVNAWVAWGTGVNGQVRTDNALTTLGAEARTAATKSVITTSSANDTAQWVGQIVSLSDQTITEFGLFDALTVGNLWIEGSLSQAVLTGDDITFTITAQF